MLALALLLQLISPPATEADAAKSETEAVLAAFREVCWTGHDVEKAVQTAQQRGWTALSTGSQPVADRLRASIESEAKPTHRVIVRQFQRKVEDRNLLLTFERGELTAPAAERFGSTRCLIRELNEPAPLDVSTALKWLGRAPSDIGQNPDGALFLSWHGLDLGAPTSVMVAYIPPKSDDIAPDFTAGIYLSTEAYGPFGAKPS